MSILTIDVETTTSNKGNPFDKTNKLCYVGMKWLDIDNVDIIDYLTGDKETYRTYIQDVINKAEMLVGFNIKFDLHWLLNIGIDLSNVNNIWDCQIAQFMLHSQRNPYNSLNDALEEYNIPLKEDKVKEYWEQGVDTPYIPKEIIMSYLKWDVKSTELVYLKQREILL